MWRGILRDVFRLKEHVVEFDGGAIILWGHPLHRQLISTPFRDRAALLGDDVELKPETFANFNKVSQSYIVKDVPFIDGTNGEKDYAHAFINSDVALDDDIEKRLDRSARKNLRKAQQEYGLELVVNPDGVFEEFYDLYLTTRRRLGVPPYPKRMFQILFDHLGENVALFACRSPTGTNIGYLMCYLHETEMISAHIAYDFTQRDKRIADFLFFKAFTWGRSQGFSNYRFGADNKNQEGLIWSKKKLGAVPRKQFDRCNGVNESKGDDPQSAIRRILRATPRWAFQHSSLMTYLYFR